MYSLLCDNYILQWIKLFVKIKQKHFSDLPPLQIKAYIV